MVGGGESVESVSFQKLGDAAHCPLTVVLRLSN
jgi:hypothetical protein